MSRSGTCLVAMPERRPVIALVTDAIDPYHRGGKEQRYAELATRLAQRAEIHVYTMNWWQGDSPRVADGVTYHAIAPLKPLYTQDGRRSIWQAIVFAFCCLRLIARQFDVIEADHMPYVQLFPLRLVATLRRKRLVVTWHECWGPDYWRTYLGRPGMVGWWLEYASMRIPDMIIAASRQTGDQLRELTRGKTEVIVATNGIDLELVELAEPATDATDVVVVGRLLPHKRIDLLLEALAILHSQGQPLTARIVGTGPVLDSLKDHADALGLSDSVEFRQDIEGQNALYGVLKASRAAVFPTEREGFGIAVLEALACRVPVVTTSAPANYAQYLLHNAPDAGLVCEPTAPALAEAIAEILGWADERTSADADWLRQYDWNAVTDTVAGALALRASDTPHVPEYVCA